MSWGSYVIENFKLLTNSLRHKRIFKQIKLLLDLILEDCCLISSYLESPEIILIRLSLFLTSTTAHYSKM